MVNYNTPRNVSAQSEDRRPKGQVKNTTPRNRRRYPDVDRRTKTDPLAYDHRYPCMKRYAELLALRYDATSTRRGYYRQIREFFLHLKTERNWKPKSLRQSAAALRLFYVEMLGREDWEIFSQLKIRDHKELPAVLTREQALTCSTIFSCAGTASLQN